MPTTKIPDPVIIVDTREQKPFSFYGCETTRRKLETGDYSIEGLTHRVAVERKSIPDLINSLTNDRERFMREVKRMTEMKRDHQKDDGHLVLVVVEGTLQDIRVLSEGSGASFNSILASLASLHASWGLPVVFCNDRWMATTYTKELLIKFNATATRRGLSRV